MKFIKEIEELCEMYFNTIFAHLLDNENYTYTDNNMDY